MEFKIGDKCKVVGWHSGFKQGEEVEIIGNPTEGGCVLCNGADEVHWYVNTDKLEKIECDEDNEPCEEIDISEIVEDCTEEEIVVDPWEKTLMKVTQSDTTSVFGLPNLSKEEIEINKLNNQIDDLKKQIENQNMLIDYLKGEIH